MTAVAAAFAQAHSAERQGQVIYHNQQILGGNVVFVDPIGHRLAAEVHIGGGFQKVKGVALELHLRQISIALGRKNNIGCRSKGIQCHKSHIVPGQSILGADVSKTCDEVCLSHCNGLFVHYS